MKLAIIARPFVFHGGVETATAGLVSALVEHGHEVHLYSPPGQRPMTGVVVHRLPMPRAPALLRALLFPVVARRALRRVAYDVVQSHERTVSQDVYRAGEGCHAAYLATRGRRAARGPYHRLVLALERRVFSRTPRVVAIARRGKEEIERLYGVEPARIRVVYNGVDLDRFHPANRARFGRDLRDELGVASDTWVVAFVGSGFDRKGLATLLEAFARGDPASALVVVGKGDVARYRELADRLGIGGRVRWGGPQMVVERWYAAADVVALPSRYEPFGNAHLEALASGVPVVTSTAAGGAELVQQGSNGAVVAPDDPAGLAVALDLVRSLKRETVTDAARRSAEPFTYAAQVAGFERVYRDIRPVRGDFR